MLAMDQIFISTMNRKQIILALNEKSNQELYDTVCKYFEENFICRDIVSMIMCNTSNTCYTLVRDYLMDRLLEVDIVELRKYL